MFWFFLFSNTANNTHSPLATRLNYDWLKTYWDFRVCSRPSLSNTDAAGPLIPSWLYDPPATGPATMWVVRYSYVKARALVEHHIRELCSLMCRDEKVLNIHAWNHTNSFGLKHLYHHNFAFLRSTKSETLRQMTERINVTEIKLTHLIHVVARWPDEVFTVGFVPISLVHHQIDRHFPFQTADVSMAEVITELMNLKLNMLL